MEVTLDQKDNHIRTIAQLQSDLDKANKARTDPEEMRHLHGSQSSRHGSQASGRSAPRDSP
ncbi:hypothetical protein PG996_013838 [Apiospora saccharicola]|uniref:Uncharacterized protein n=1 Tax=Apiospora saccharicola TaxID=335842 RepID=A0ABR1TGM3_9PEZI